MPKYQYWAMDVQGHLYSGREDATTLQDLARLLQEKHLFLINGKNPGEGRFWNKIHFRIPPAFLTAAAVIRHFVKPLHALIAGVAVIGLMSGYLATRSKPLFYTKPRSPVIGRVSAIGPGTTRATVEGIVLFSKGTEVASVTWYVEDDGVMVGVKYDKSGGPGSPANKLLSKPQIVISGETNF